MTAWPVTGCVIAALAAAGPAAAQTASPTAALEEIVVTAQKREQRAQDVGITLNVHSGEKLAELGAVDVPDIARLTPAVGLSGSFGGQNLMFTVRGVTQQDFQAHAESPVAVYVDEGYLAANNVSGIGLFDIERVEVLKGPQGTLFGRNATGGLVSITTRKPTEVLEGYGNVSFGSYSSMRAEAALSGPISESAQGRIALAYDRNDGWIDNVNPNGDDLGGRRRKAVRAHLAVQPGAMDLLFTGFYGDTDQSWGPYMLLSTRSTLENGVPNSVVVDAPTLFGEPPSDAKNLEVDANSAQDDGSYNRIGGATIRLSFERGGAELTSITDYKRLEYRLLLDDDASAATYFDTDAAAEVANWSQELRLFEDFGQTRLTAGVYYLHIDAAQVDLQRPFFLGVQVSSPFELKTESYSGFFQVEHALTDRWKLVGGLRITREEKDFAYEAELQAFDGTPIALARSYQGSLGDWLPSGKLQIEYRPAADVLLFAGYSRGAKAGSFNAPFAGGATPPDSEVPYEPEKLDSFEIGAKTAVLDGRATLNGSVFYYDYKDYQAFKFANLSTVVTNNPARITGIELDFDFRPAPGLELTLGASYVDAQVEDVLVANALGSAVLTRRPPYFSKFRAVGSGRYTIPLPNGSLNLQADVQHSSSSFVSLTNFDATRVDPNTLVGARIAWESSDGSWEVTAFGRNLTDERYETVGFDASDFGGFMQIGYGEPRWYGASLGFRF